MTDIQKLIALNAQRWRAAKTKRDFSHVARRLLSGKSRYLSVQSRTGVPWFVIAVIHEREASGDWNTQLGQGDPLNEVSRHVPAGRGPFKTWEDGAYDALVHCEPRASNWRDWSAGGALTLLEKYNGLGYADHGVPSPYVWSGTDQYKIGKITRDHGPIEPVVDAQLGCAGLLMAMREIDTTIRFADEAMPPPDIHPPEQKDIAPHTLGPATGTLAGAAAHALGFPIWASLSIAFIVGLAIYFIVKKGK